MKHKITVDPYLSCFCNPSYEDTVSSPPPLAMARKMINDVMCAGEAGIKSLHVFVWGGRIQSYLSGGYLDHLNFAAAFGSSDRIEFKVKPGQEDCVIVEVYFFKYGKKKPHFTMIAGFDHQGNGGIGSCVINHIE